MSDAIFFPPHSRKFSEVFTFYYQKKKRFHIPQQQNAPVRSICNRKPLLKFLKFLTRNTIEVWKVLNVIHTPVKMMYTFFVSPLSDEAICIY